jgi:hypothetical protein
MPNFDPHTGAQPITRRQALRTGAAAVGTAVARSSVAADPKTRIKIGQIGVGHAHASKLSVYRNSPASSNPTRDCGERRRTRPRIRG